MSEAPVVQSATAGSRTRGFLFADLRGYTDYLEAHGDHAGAQLLATYREFVRAAVATAQGAEIRTEGDSFFVVFDSASAAVRCGLDIAARAAAATPPVAVGVGIHAGETVETEEGLVGSAVNVAARVSAQAHAGEVLVTDTVRGLTRTFLDVRFVPVGPRRLKGLAEPVMLYRAQAPGVGGPVRDRHPARSGPRILSAAVGLAVVAIILLGGAWAMGQRASPGPSPTPTGSAPSTMTPTPLPSATESPFPNPSEVRLLDRLPGPVRNNATCRRSAVEERSLGATASIRCDLTPGLGASIAWFESFGPASLALDTYAVRTGRFVLPEGDCAVQPRAWQEWSLTGIYAGHLGCYADAGAAWLIWTYDADGVLARATRPDANWSALHTWWKSVGPFLRD